MIENGARPSTTFADVDNIVVVVVFTIVVLVVFTPVMSSTIVDVSTFLFSSVSTIFSSSPFFRGCSGVENAVGTAFTSCD